MTDHRDTDMSERLEPLIGEWNMQAVFPSSSPIDSSEAHGAARTVFGWLPGRQFLVQRWEVAHPAAPDGIAITGFDASQGCYLQHYFDSRRVARLYEMSFGDRVWKLWRTKPDFSRSISRNATQGPSAKTAARSYAVGSPPATARTGSTTSN